MLKSRMMFAVALVALAIAGSAPAQAEILQLAQGTSCSSFQTTCANRCRVRAPQDVNCVSDHCTPKLMTCKRDGCWQEGRQYGGKRTCGLAKS